MTDRYVAGERAGDLASAYRINRKTVTTIVRRNGGTVRSQREGGRRPWRHFTGEEIARMAERWHAGESQTAIAHAFDTTQTVVSRMLAGAGVESATGRFRARRGAASNLWKGGVVRNPYGYVLELVPQSDPFASMRARSGYVLQHRLVMARSLGRPLEPSETVHHINGLRDDNRIENLQLRQGKHGRGIRYVCGDCGSHNVVSATIGVEA